MLSNRLRRRSLLVLAVLALVPPAALAREARQTSAHDAGPECDGAISPITSGYGADGPLKMERLTVPQSRGDDVPVFAPQDDPGQRRPVIFFSHGYGPNLWQVYEPFIRHVVSKGAIVVFSPFPMGGATMERRYQALWGGFEAAVNQLGSRMDLARVGFVGHSFGGGANLAMAYEGLVKRGWGRQGALMFELAPWYPFGISDEKIAQIPADVVHAVQVYDEDRMNDHRMAFDIHRAMRTRTNLVFQVKSMTVGRCTLVAEHMLPSRTKNATIKQYGLLRPMDLLMQAAFERPDPGALAAIQRPSPEGYQPLEVLSNLEPAHPESYYRFAWGGRMNPRKPGADVRGQFDDLPNLDGSGEADAPASSPRRGLLRRWLER